jgi:hypothetical protein
MSWLDRDDEDEKPHTTSLRMWSTSDKKPRGGNARMWSTSDHPGRGNAFVWSTSRPKPEPSARDLEEIRLEWERAAEDGINLRTGGWAPGWKPAPLPGTPQEARERQLRTRFKYYEQRDTTLEWTDTKARSAARKGGKRRSTRKTEANRRKGRYGYLGAKYGKLGGRPRKRPTGA